MNNGSSVIDNSKFMHTHKQSITLKPKLQIYKSQNTMYV